MFIPPLRRAIPARVLAAASPVQSPLLALRSRSSISSERHGAHTPCPPAVPCKPRGRHRHYDPIRLPTRQSQNPLAASHEHAFRPSVPDKAQSPSRFLPLVETLGELAG